MIRRRIFITAAFVCHLLIAPGIVTAQLLCPTPSAAALKGDVADVCAIEQEKEGSIYKLHHRGRIAFRSFILWADEATYNSDSGMVEAEGHVLLEGGLNDEYIQASRATYDTQNDTGRFYHVIGTIGAKQHGGLHLLTTTNPFAFTGKVVDKTGPERYVVHHGTVTSCELPHPKWQFYSPHSVINVEGNAHIYLTTFRVYGMPVLFLPFATHPVQRQARQSGFLMPSFGTSSVKGTILGDSFYWAINRSMDATVGAELFSMRGWAQHAEFRAVPSANSYALLSYFGVEDRGNPKTKQQQGGREIRFNGTDTFAGFRGVTSIDYLSSFAFRIVWGQIFSAVYSEVISQGFLSKSSRGYSYNLWLQHYQNFLSTAPNQVVTIEHLPSLGFSSVDRPFGQSGFYWNLDTAAEALSRSQPPLSSGEVGFSTARLVGRLDANPEISWPLHFHGWSLRPAIGARDTFYTQQLTPGQRFPCAPLCQVGQNPTPSPYVANNDPINRKALEGAVELRPPSLERVFKGTVFGSKLKHVVEPRIVYRRVGGVDDFLRIPRLDWRDVLSDTHEVEYDIVNRLFAKKEDPGSCATTGSPAVMPPVGITEQGQVSADAQLPQNITAPAKSSSNEGKEVLEGKKDVTTPCAPPGAHELISWELAQKYFLDSRFGGALIPGQPNVFATTVDFDALAFLTTPRRLSPLISRLRFQPSSIDVAWDADYDFTGRRINYSSLTLGYHLGQFGLAGGDTYLVVPGVVTITKPDVFNQARAQITYGSPVKRGLSGTSLMGFDIHSGFLQYLAVQSSYNWDCCGFTVDFRRFVLGPLRNENQYRFTFNVANIGSFGNLTRRYRMY